jgi:predicted acetyltransferase
VATVDLVKVTDDDKPALGNLIQFYCYELSAVRHFEVTKHGLYVYRYLDHYFVDSDREAFFVRHGDALAGFALSRQLVSGEREVAEFFVMRRHRRHAVGRRAADQLFARHAGTWVVAYDDDNGDAAAFWPPVIQAAADGEPHRDHIGPPEHRFAQTVLRFSIHQ